MLIAAALLLGGLVLLTAGADRMVVSAARLSRLLGLSPVLIGALVVGFGTSAPELLVSVLAGRRGEIELAIGNVVGSNVSNVTLVLGATALVTPLVARLQILRREGVLMLLAVTGLAAAAADLRIERWEAALLAGGMVVAALLLVIWARRDEGAVAVAAEVDQMTGGTRAPRYEAIVGLLSLAVTLAGAELFVRGAQRLATELDISAAFVGLTVVAVGTSLPELATSLAAARRREADLVVGNVLGSNLFNSLIVAGAAGLAGPGTVSSSFRPALVLMVLFAVVAGAFTATGSRVVRWEGFVLVLGFVAFVAVVI